MSDERDERRQRLDERLRAQHAQHTRADVIADVQMLTGCVPTLDDFLSAEATARHVRRYLAASSAQDVQRQAWSADLAAEAKRALAEAAASLGGTSMYWLHRLAEDVGAVHVPGDAVLHHAAASFEPGDYDVVLVGDNGDDGVRFAWDHLPNGDEYELVRWGAFRRAA